MKRILLAVTVAALLAGCSGGGDPAPVPTTSGSPVSQEKQATIDGEWVLSRTVTETDDVNNPAHAVATVSTRYVLFANVQCTVGPCTGAVISGPTQGIRDTSDFTSAGDVISYEFSGFINCVRQDTGAILVPDGYAYTATVELTVLALDEADPTRAATLEGTLTYTDTPTNEALEAGCSREPVTATTEYALTAVRGVAAPAPSASATPAP